MTRLACVDGTYAHRTVLAPPNGPRVTGACVRCGRAVDLPAIPEDETKTANFNPKGKRGPALRLMPARTPTERVYSDARVRSRR